MFRPLFSSDPSSRFQPKGKNRLRNDFKEQKPPKLSLNGHIHLAQSEGDEVVSSLNEEQKGLLPTLHREKV